MTNFIKNAIIDYRNSILLKFGGDLVAALYPNLVSAVAMRGIKKTAIASRLGISARSLYSKMNGTAPFTWDEICGIHDNFFPDIEKDILFEKKTQEHINL